MWLYWEIEPLKKQLRLGESKGGRLNPLKLVSLEEEETLGMCVHRERAVWEHSKHVAICKPERQALRETKPKDTLISEFPPPEL